MKRCAPTLIGLIALTGAAVAEEWPAPTGPHGVGVRSMELVDETRSEDYTADSEDRRRLMVELWYPADRDPSAGRAPYLADGKMANQSRMRMLGMTEALGPLSALRTGAYVDAPPTEADSPWPIVLFSHGNSDTRRNNSAQCEELASHGYFDVGIDHTYGASVVEFPSRKRILYRDSFPDESDVEPSERDPDRKFNVWVADVGFVLDRLKQMAGAADFEGRLDLDRIGMFGHSFGGTTAAEICRSDPRVRAGVDMDGSLRGAVLTERIGKPFLFMLREGAGADASSADRTALSMRRQRMAKAAEGTGGGVIISIDGMTHMNFCDLPLLVALAPGSQPGELIGSIEAFRGVRIINAYLLQFFDLNLRGRPAPLLEGPAHNYPEVRFERIESTPRGEK